MNTKNILEALMQPAIEEEEVEKEECLSSDEMGLYNEEDDDYDEDRDDYDDEYYYGNEYLDQIDDLISTLSSIKDTLEDAEYEYSDYDRVGSYITEISEELTRLSEAAESYV